MKHNRPNPKPRSPLPEQREKVYWDRRTRRQRTRGDATRRALHEALQEWRDARIERP